MPIEVGLWRIEQNNTYKIISESIGTEKRLEDVIYGNISIVNDGYLVLGRQVRTDYGKIIDLLAIDETGKIIIIELKRLKTPREVVAQTLDYASWVQDLSYTEIIDIYSDNNPDSFEKAFEEKFGTAPPEKLNQEHEMLIICSELDNETERIINYLSDNYSVPINAVFFRFFIINGTEVISRTWLIDPNEVEEKYSKSKHQNKSEPWNGRDFIVNIDTNASGTSAWEDCLKYGFISAGGGRWYSRSLNQLEIGHRVFAMIPKKGYLGVGIVKEKSVAIKDFNVADTDGVEKPILEFPIRFPDLKNNVEDMDKCNYLVRIDWVYYKVREEDAYWEKGLRANQNSAFKLKNSYTLTKLLDHFEIDE